MIALLAVCALASAQPEGALPQILLSSSFEGDLEGWTLQLNRGAQAELSYVDDAVMDARSLRIQPTLLCAPDNQSFPTNVHIWYDSFPLEAGRRYRLSAWAKAEGPARPLTLAARRATEAMSICGNTFEVGEYWRRFELMIAPAADVPDARLQIICGNDERALLIDRVSFAEVPDGEPLPADYIAWGSQWASPEMWQGAVTALTDPPTVRFTGAITYLRDLPAWFRMRVFLRSAEACSVTLGYENGDQTTLDLKAGAVLPVLFERGPVEPGDARPIAPPAPSRLAIVAGGTPVEIVHMEGDELLPGVRAGGGSEVGEPYTDPETGARIVRLTHSIFEDKHAYYDISPWSPDGSKILFCSAFPERRDSSVWVMDADGANLRKIADAENWSYHTGNFPMWAHDGKSVYFHTYRQVDGERISGTARVWLDDLHEDFLDLGARQLNPKDGRLLEVLSNPDEPERGLFCYAADGTGRTMLASMDAILALSPSRELAAGLRLNLQNCKWSPDGEKCFVVFAGRDEKGRAKFVEVYAMRADGSDLCYTLTMSHHPMWHPDSEHILYNGPDGMYLAKWDGAGETKVSDTAWGHPSYSPDGRWICTDGYGPDWSDTLILISAATGQARKLCTLPNVHGRTHARGTQPHPCWSPDGKSVLYDSDETGRSQLYQVFIEDVARTIEDG